MNDVLKAALPSIISAALPTLMVLVGILLNRNDINRLDGRISSLEAKMDGRMSSLEAKMDSLAASLRSEMASLAANLRAEMAQTLDTFHSDIVMLLQRDGEKDNRIMRLE